MTYTPQTRWIVTSPPLQDPGGGGEPNSRRLRKMSKANVIALLTARPWLTAVEVATALATAPQGLSQTQAAERTMRRMHQCGVVDRRRTEAGKYAYGVKA